MTSRVARSEHVPLQEREVPLLAEDEMIEYLDTQELSCLAKAPGDITIFRRWFKISTRVVVRYDDCCCPLSDSFAEDLGFVVITAIALVIIHAQKKEAVYGN